MPYSTPFESLSPEAVESLSDPQSSDLKMVYIDCLAMLHDVLSDFGSSPEHPVFANRGQPIDQAAIRSTAADLQRQVGTVFENVGINMEIAFDLRREATSLSSVTSSMSRHLVDNYLESLLNQYQVLR